jgi:hypothetical protein
MKTDDVLPYWPALFIAGAVVMGAAGVYSWLKKRPTPAELERRRREMVNQIGKMGDGTVTEVQQPLITYTYHVRGIEYQAIQDISGLEASLPSEQWGVIGSVSVKYDPRNPANSIILSEHWSGLRKTSLGA